MVQFSKALLSATITIVALPSIGTISISLTKPAISAEH
jgi:hypothetical protein